MTRKFLFRYREQNWNKHTAKSDIGCHQSGFMTECTTCRKLSDESFIDQYLELIFFFF